MQPDPRDAADDLMAPGGFDGESYDDDRDRKRLARQMSRVRVALSDGQWWTLARLAEVSEASTQSASARVRDLRKVRFGGYTIERRYAGDGVFEYRMDLEQDHLDCAAA
jgi:hypothetical protein